MKDKYDIEIIQWYKDTISECDASDKTAEELLEQFKGYKYDMRNKTEPKRFQYGTVGYGVFSILGDFYRMGRVEIYDRDSESPYSSGEGTYCMPFEQAESFEDFISSLESDLPIQFDLGSVDECRDEVIKELGITKEQFKDKEFTQQYWKDKAEKNIEELKDKGEPW